MGQPLGQSRVVLSLFNRLTDRDPRSVHEGTANTWDQLQELKHSVARDLTDLLNTRRRESDIPEEFTEVTRSIAAFGMRDLSSSPIDREQIRRAIENCVRTFEPRLSHVSVFVEETAVSQVGFRIVAMLRIELRTEPVAYDAILPKHSRRFSVQESR